MCVWDWLHDILFTHNGNANTGSGLYPFFHCSLLNDFGSFALWISVRLHESAHTIVCGSVLMSGFGFVAIEITDYNVR